MAADPLDIRSPADALVAINRTGTAPSGLEQMVTAVSRAIDMLVGPVVVRTVTAEVHAGGCPSVWLRRRPVSSVTTVREITGPGSISTLSAVAWGAATDGYYPVASNRVGSPTLLSGELRRVQGGYDDNWGLVSGETWLDRAVEVTYVAGRYATTSVVDRRFAEACAAVLRRLWKRESGAWAQSPQFFTTDDESVAPTSGFFRAVKPVVMELLADEMIWEPGLA